MPIEIKHRCTGDVLHTVDADTLIGANLSGANLSGADLSWADLGGANLSGANLSGANLSGACLGGANLSGACLSGADLYWADLSGADLNGADLSWADLRGACLSGACLSRAIIFGDKLERLLARATRLDGYEFLLFALQSAPPKIKAGCRWMSVADYRAHVAKDYPDTDKARETLQILDYFDACSAALTEQT